MRRRHKRPSLLRCGATVGDGRLIAPLVVDDRDRRRLGRRRVGRRRLGRHRVGRRRLDRRRLIVVSVTLIDIMLINPYSKNNRLNQLIFF